MVTDKKIVRTLNPTTGITETKALIPPEGMKMGEMLPGGVWLQDQDGNWQYTMLSRCRVETEDDR